MTQTIYADGIANLSLVDGVLRYDLVNITTLEQNKANVRPVASVAMSLPALLRTYEQLTGVIDKLVEQGLLKKSLPPAPVAADVSVAPSATSLN